MKPTLRSELPVLLLILLMVAISAAVWSRMPDRVPVHFGFDLQPNRWGHKAELLIPIPIIALFMEAFLLVAPRFDTRRANDPTFESSYRVIRVATITVFVVVHAGILAVTLNKTGPDLRAFLMPGLGGLLIVVGSVLGKVGPNGFVGVRTPWTLSSKDAWARANHAAGWVFIVGGALLVVAGVIRESWTMWLAGGFLAAGLVAVVVDSYVTWRADPDKQPPAGTTPASEA